MGVPVVNSIKEEQKIRVFRQSKFESLSQPYLFQFKYNFVNCCDSRIFIICTTLRMTNWTPIASTEHKTAQYTFTRTEPKSGFRGGSWMVSNFLWSLQSPTCRLYGARRNTSYGVLLFVLLTFCISTRILMRAHVYGCFYLLLCDETFREQRTPWR